MLGTKTSVGIFCLLSALLIASGCGSGTAVDTTIGAISITTEAIPPGGAGELYNAVLVCASEGGAAPPDSFEVEQGSLPPGVNLIRDRVDADGDGLPDPDGAYTGDARLVGFPFESGTYVFTVKAISTGDMGDPDQPDLATRTEFTLVVGDGSITFISPTAEEGTVDPSVPAFPDVVDFVNPANPQAFFSFAFLAAGGSGQNLLNVYLPREIELSVFDTPIVDGTYPPSMDTDEKDLSGGSLDVYFADGGLFVLQAGGRKVQVGGFQSPRGKVGTLTQYPGGQGLDPVWFQKAPGDGGPARNSRRDLLDTLGLAAGDTTLGTPQPVRFSDYFDASYEGTNPGFNAPPLVRRKYPFTADEYQNAFFMPYTAGVHVTELRYRIIAEAIDTRGTTTKDDDVIARKAYVAQVKIPDIRIDTVALPAGQAGVDYTEFVNASGGVPPLTFKLEWVDATLDLDTTAPDLKTGFGLEMDPATGQFFGVPNASGTVELSCVVSGDVMNPSQSSAGYIPSAANPGEYAGTNPLTGNAGVHRTWAVDFALPTAPYITNGGLNPGEDGLAYMGDQVTGTGGVPKLIPSPVGFVGTYPAGQVARTYDYSASYVRDSSHGGNAGQPESGLPRSLELDGDATSINNGRITGVATDRGFHPVTFTQFDFYLGDITVFALTQRQSSNKTLPLSISPDTAVYMRGAPTASGGTPSGLLDETKQMGEVRMVPMFQSGALYRVDTGQMPRLFDSTVPRKIDFLPVMLCNGGSDAHVDKSIPSVSGVWPAESNKLDRWWYYYYGYSEASWKHLQQETCWIQTPTADQKRIYLWAESKIKSFGSSSSGADSKRYQQYDVNGKRGILIENPLTGEIWVPAVLTNAKNDGDGFQFGAESVWACGGYAPYYSSYVYYYGGDTRYYSYMYYIRGDREVRLQGMGSYLESYERSSSGRLPQGRTATSVAVSADGVWAATAMPGGNEQKILLWRTDKQPIPQDILNQPFVTGLNGVDADGTSLTNSACIFSIGGEATSGGPTIYTNQRYLLPDSLMFVRDGLIFLCERQLDYVFGLSLVDGHLSARSLNSRTEVTSGQGTGPSVSSTRGQFVPDQDYVRGMKATQDYAVQFSFVGNDPNGEEGPDKVAFVAGDNKNLYAFDDYSGSYTRLPDQVRNGYAMSGNRNRALLFLETSTGANGLDLAGSTLKDLTGRDSRIYGDLMTPGRPGEELDFLAVSPDGKYVAVVRDLYTYNEYTSSYYARAPQFATMTTSSTSYYYVCTDDVLICATTDEDMDSSTSATETVLYLGSGNYSNGYSGTPSANSVSYASARPYLNAKGRRVNGLRFAPDGRTLILHYAGDGSYWTKYMGGSNQYAINAHPSQYGPYQTLSAQITIRVQFRTSGGGAINFPNNASSFMKNNLQGLSSSGITQIGDTSAPFGPTSSNQQFWATFRSENGKFLYYISDQISGRNYLVGINMSATTVNGHAPYVPFTPHAGTIGFEQFDCNSWNYENRFFAVPGGVEYRASGRDGAGIVFLVGSAASAGATNATDLEIYAFDANNGGDLVALTSDATDGSANAINHLYVSADGNFLVAQRCKTTSNSSGSRATLNGANDLIAVNNVHAALAGATPNAFLVSEDMSHGSTVAFVGENTATGPQAVVFSSAPKGTNTTWDDRTLKLGLLTEGMDPVVLDSTKSHYVVLAGTRKVDDNPDTSD